MIRTANISTDGRYRWRLDRRWGDGPNITWCLLNPSTADGEHDDQTIRQCVKFSQREGFDRLTVVNLYAWRATHPTDLPDDPATAQGELNRGFVEQAIYQSAAFVCAWGATVGPQPRLDVEGIARRLGMLGCPVICLGFTKDGHPRHPCRLADDTPFVTWPSGESWRPLWARPTLDLFAGSDS